MAKRLSDATVCRQKKCKTCVFHPGAEVVSPARLVEIQDYLIKGTNHLCHTDDNTVCRGGREYQLMIWSRLGIIAEPTDAALASAMKQMGNEPKRFVHESGND